MTDKIVTEAMIEEPALDDDAECPICHVRSTFKGNPALSFCDKHYRQYLATFQVRPKDLAAYRAEQINRLQAKAPETD